MTRTAHHVILEMLKKNATIFTDTSRPLLTESDTKLLLNILFLYLSGEDDMLTLTSVHKPDL